MDTSICLHLPSGLTKSWIYMFGVLCWDHKAFSKRALLQVSYLIYIHPSASLSCGIQTLCGSHFLPSTMGGPSYRPEKSRDSLKQDQQMSNGHPWVSPWVYPWASPLVILLEWPPFRPVSHRPSTALESPTLATRRRSRCW